MDRLKDKVAIVFGAGPNIGGTIAHFLAREGARVCVMDISEAAVNESVAYLQDRGLACFGVVGNAREYEEVGKAVAATVEKYGRLDVVVNMAGRVHWSHVLDMKLNDWNDAVASFATAGLITTQHCARAMIECGNGGSIIHILSTAAHFGEADGSAYCAAKAALLSFARSSSLDLAHLGIRVNSVTPCSMEHQLWSTMRDEMFNPDWREPDQIGFYSRQEYLDQMPLRRFPKAADLAWATVFLASDESSCITGADIAVDGGLRHKYPTWTPGKHFPLDIRDYARNTQLTKYGDPQGPLTDSYGEPV